jgi:hypothetical protein
MKKIPMILIVAVIVTALAAWFEWSEEKTVPGQNAGIASSDGQKEVSPDQLAEQRAQQTDIDFPFVINFVTGIPDSGKFSPGDEIVITSVKGDRNHIERGGSYAVEGTYTLASMDNARLAISVIAPAPDLSDTISGAISPTNQQGGSIVSRGTGQFSLKTTVLHAGTVHVSFGPTGGGDSRGTVTISEK